MRPHTTTNDAGRMNRAVGAHGLFVPMTWGDAPCWYEAALWPKLYAMHNHYEAYVWE